MVMIHYFLFVISCLLLQQPVHGPRLITTDGQPIYASYQPVQYIQTAIPGTVVTTNPPTETIRRVHYPPDQYVQTYAAPFRQNPPEVILQRDFRKISGITSEMFKQIEAVEKIHDRTTATLIEAVERRGDMVIRLLDPRALGRPGMDAFARYQANSPPGTDIQFVEIIKKPAQTLGLYIREGDGLTSNEGVFISRIGRESTIYTSGILKVGDEILAINLVDVHRMKLDDVVIVMSIPRRLVLTIRPAIHPQQQSTTQPIMNAIQSDGEEVYNSAPVVVVKKEIQEEPFDVEDLPLCDPRTHRVTLDDEILDRPLSRLSVMRPPSRNILRPMTHTRDDTYVQIYQKAADARTRPPLYHQGMVMPSRHHTNSMRRGFPRTLENLVEESDYTSGYMSDGFVSNRRKSATLSRLSHRPSMMHPTAQGMRSGRYSSMSNRFWEDRDPLMRHDPHVMSRPGSVLGILPTTSEDDGFMDAYTRPLSRLSCMSGASASQSLATIQGLRNRRNRLAVETDDLRASITASRMGMRSRRTFADGTASDTETSNRPYLGNHGLPGRYSRMSGRSSVAERLRTSSLPRRPLYPGAGRPHSRSQMMTAGLSTRHSGRHSSLLYDEDSDGAASAPDLPDKPKRLLKKRLPAHSYSSNEYQQWMTRAPSTSALYETLSRRPRSRVGPALPSGLSDHSLSKIAHSAESLLDTIRLEAQKNLLVDLYANRGAVAASLSGRPPSAASLLNRDASDALLRMKHHPSGQARHAPTLRERAVAGDFMRNAIPNPTPVKPSEDARMHLLTLNPREFFKYKYEKTNQDHDHHLPHSSLSDVHDNTHASSNITDSSVTKTGMGFSGLLWIHLLAGRGLRATPSASNTTSSGKPSAGLNRDLYCVIECDRVHRARTVVRSGESSFDWDEVFELDIIDCKETSFLLYSWDPESKHKLCYKGIVNLISLALAKTPVHSLALKMEPRGTLYIKMRYKEPAIAFQRPTPSPGSPPAIFGVDIETVVKRENSGSKYPLILKRCIEEVDKRGVSVVGIYRLCGSAVRKKMLREAFEKNAWLVDLSAEHVPDINVITSE